MRSKNNVVETVEEEIMKDMTEANDMKSMESQLEPRVKNQDHEAIQPNKVDIMESQTKPCMKEIQWRSIHSYLPKPRDVEVSNEVTSLVNSGEMAWERGIDDHNGTVQKVTN